MTTKFAKNLIDGDLSESIALPSTDEAVTSPDIDLGGPLEAARDSVELLIDIPPLTLTEFPEADTLDIVIQHGDSASPTDELLSLPQIVGGASAYEGDRLRAALPSNTKRYVNAKITAAGSVGDMSGKSAVVSLAV